MTKNAIMFNSIISSQKFRLTILLIILVEIVSFLGYYFPPVNQIAFFIVVLITLIVSLKKLEYGLWLVLVELLIGSKGYLLYFATDGLIISIRQALWLIVMSVWLAQTLIYYFKNKKIDLRLTNFKFWPYFSVFFIFLSWGIINGYLHGHSFDNLFFDFNGWLYLALILPIFTSFKDQKSFNNLISVSAAAISWLIFKTLLYLYFFSHNFFPFTEDLYRWTRLTGVGEITQIQGGFFRIFFQSQIFILPVLTIVLIFFALQFRKNFQLKFKQIIGYLVILVLLFTTLIISFSRSFWFGGLAGLVTLWLAWFLILKIKLIEWLKINAYLSLAVLISLVLILAVVKFPWPAPTGGFATLDILGQRASQLAGEAGVASRWALITPLWQKIKQSAIFGQGFGATVIYQTSDPRILQINPSGEYSTYAFEWGWLDVWLKLGLLGLLAYLTLIIKIIHSSLALVKNYTDSNFNQSLIIGLAGGLIVICFVSIFSPYTNHPLGLGYLILTAVIINNFKQKLPLA